MASLIEPYGGKLVNLVVESEDEKKKIFEEAAFLPSLQLTARNLCDLEMLATGSFSPLDRFMGKSDYESVLREMKLSSGILWPLPITLTANSDQIPEVGETIVLRSAKFDIVALMKLEEVFEWSAEREGKLAYGTNDKKHPMVQEMDHWGKVCISGALRVVHIPKPYDFTSWRHTPRELREILKGMNARDVVGFQTRNPLHRVHEELTKRAAAQVGGVLVLHPVVGMTKPGDVSYFTRARIYISLYENYYDRSQTVLSFLPLAMRMAGPKEAVLHAIVRRNHGISHFIVGRDHAGPGNDSAGQAIYDPYGAQTLVKELEEVLGVIMIPFKMLVYLPEEQRYEEVDKVKEGVTTLSVSGTEVRNEYLAKGRLLPPWFTRPETASILQEAYPTHAKQGVCLWFTGLSGSGKSTIASIVSVMLREVGRDSTVLDGDVIRTHLSKGLGFSREDRNTNVLRIAFVASALIRHGGVAICAAISPYASIRDEARAMCSNFVEIHISTPLEVCEARDSKMLYSRARKALADGKPMHFTGIDDPYEAPRSPEIEINSPSDADPRALASKVLKYLAHRGFISLAKTKCNEYP